MELWTGKPVDYSRLHIFGSPAYVMYHAQDVLKLDPKSRKCIFLGYADSVKGYRLWDPTTRKVVISRDVIFTEDKHCSEDAGTLGSDNTVIQVNEHSSEIVSDQSPMEDDAEVTELRRSTRTKTAPIWHTNFHMDSNVVYCLLTEDGEPSTFQEAVGGSDAYQWIAAMQEEIEALHKNQTWDLVQLPSGRKSIGNK